jgi:YHS domain-containing protein
MSRWHFFIISITVIALLGLLAGCGQKEESARMGELAGQEETAPMDTTMQKDEPVREAEVMNAQVVDPACGMEVDPETALSAEYQDHMYYFCSAQCRDSFLKDPEKYISPAEHHVGEKMPGGHGH